ncbi:GrpB family protein [Fusibacter ferrireducens]|uniref:GrpB family protein n=1 Tax=Fusibacter ferrireducens TaxID=2785058 RepID=A0ABR9ZPX4_9FIRM|nr:GrpB family protein [Fusibacter ferrireducens]MBF4691980.1 GrpB family protein [Fusibacter ferrireducens]
MSKELSQMSLEELWTLFPIILKEHNENYKQWYDEEESNIRSFLSRKEISRISHIGSSAVKGLLSKPTVDILLEITPDTAMSEISKILCQNGWTLMNTQMTPYLSYVFNKGYTKDGFAEKVYHLHMRSAGDWDELYFRDYLIDHPEVANAYGYLKQDLLSSYKHDREGYTEAKTEFIAHFTKKARELYGKEK